MTRAGVALLLVVGWLFVAGVAGGGTPAGAVAAETRAGQAPATAPSDHSIGADVAVRTRGRTLPAAVLPAAVGIVVLALRRRLPALLTSPGHFWLGRTAVGSRGPPLLTR